MCRCINLWNAGICLRTGSILINSPDKNVALMLVWDMPKADFYPLSLRRYGIKNLLIHKQLETNSMIRSVDKQ